MPLFQPPLITIVYSTLRRDETVGSCYERLCKASVLCIFKNGALRNLDPNFGQIPLVPFPVSADISLTILRYSPPRPPPGGYDAVRLNQCYTAIQP